MRLKVICLIIIVGLVAPALEVYSDNIVQSVKGHSLLSRLILYRDGEDANLANEEAKPLENFYVTILGNDPEYGYTFQEINQLNPQESIQKDPSLPVYIQIGSEPGHNEESTPETAKPNATIEQRGQSTRGGILKSYKIKLASRTELWRKQKVINLNKHPYDDSSIRNKLSFDYFKLIPNIVSSETQFARLYVRDLTSASGQSNFVDYGLFTHIEQVNKDFLSRHGLDPEGYLYKAINFEFNRYPEQLRNRDDPFYDPEQFETILEIRGREYHDGLTRMLDDINNQELDFNQVFDRYFDRDNFLTWLAMNILMTNLDTSSNNFYLYSSRFSDKWYFLPWDYDGAWDFYWQWGRSSSRLHPAREGISRYWGWPLIRRFFEQPNNVIALNDKIEELSLIITEKQTRAFLDEYNPVIRPLALQLPDVQKLPEDTERFDEEYYSLVKIPTKNRQKYYDLLHKPMPIFTGGPWIEEGKNKMTFTWWESFSLLGNDIIYDLQISDNPEFTTTYYEARSINGVQWTMGIIPPGTYYWKVIIRDSEGNEQIPFESFIDENRNYYHGVKTFTIEHQEGA